MLHHDSVPVVRFHDRAQELARLKPATCVDVPYVQRLTRIAGVNAVYDLIPFDHGVSELEQFVTECTIHTVLKLV